MSGDEKNGLKKNYKNLTNDFVLNSETNLKDPDIIVSTRNEASNENKYLGPDNIEVSIHDDERNESEECRKSHLCDIKTQSNITQNILIKNNKETEFKKFGKCKKLVLPKRNLGTGQKHANELW